MSIFKRGGYWHVHIEIKGAKAVRESTKLEATASNKAVAQAYHDQLKADLWRVVKGGERPVKYWEDAVVKWIEEKSHKKSLKDDVGMFRWLNQHLAGRRLDALTRDAIDTVLSKKEREASPSRANRYGALIRAVLNKSEREWTDGQWSWLERAPKVRMRKEPKHRISWLSPSQIERLMEELPQHLIAPVIFTLQTGLRASNCRLLKWKQVDQVRGVLFFEAEDMKAGKRLGVPLNSIALNVLRECQKNNMQDVYVFEYKGNVMSKFTRDAWYKALKRANIKDFRWHDLRHTWASNHARAGTPMHVLQKLGGWETAAMVDVYAHLAPEHMGGYAESICSDDRAGVDKIRRVK